MIYLASPYSHPEPAVRQRRYEQTMAAQAYLLRRGEHVYSPIVACHPMALAHDLPTDAEWWAEYNLDMLKRCSDVYVLCLFGWEDSKGVAQEIEWAKQYKREPLLVDWNGSKAVFRV